MLPAGERILLRHRYEKSVPIHCNPSYEDRGITWKVSLKNADKQVDSALIDIIGREIEKHLI